MKQVFLTAPILAVSQASMLFELSDHHLLNSEEQLTPFESIAYIQTFDEVPIFGGAELRAKMLEQTRKAKNLIYGIDAIELTNNLQQGFQKVSKTLSSGIQRISNKIVFSRASQGELQYEATFEELNSESGAISLL